MRTSTQHYNPKTDHASYERDTTDASRWGRAVQLNDGSGDRWTISHEDIPAALAGEKVTMTRQPDDTTPITDDTITEEFIDGAELACREAKEAYMLLRQDIAAGDITSAAAALAYNRIALELANALKIWA